MADVLPDLIREIAATEAERTALVVDGFGGHTYRELAGRAAGSLGFVIALTSPASRP